jgi:serine/threonine kinase 16
MAQVFVDLLSSFGSCLNCFPSSPTLKINSRSFKILRLLGEVRPLTYLPPPYYTPY